MSIQTKSEVINIIPLLIYILFMNILGLAIMRYDKIKAQRFEWRISEKTIFIVALLLGGPGVLYGMYRFRHTTRHAKFVIGIPLIIILNVITIYYILKFLY